MRPAGKGVRFVDAPEVHESKPLSNPLMDALQLDETSNSSVSETKIEESFISVGNVNRYNYIGHTPHGKVIEAEESRKRLKELTKLMTMPMISQTPVRVSIPVSDLSPQSDISASPAIMFRGQHNESPEQAYETNAHFSSQNEVEVCLPSEAAQMQMLLSPPQDRVMIQQQTPATDSTSGSFNLMDAVNDNQQPQPVIRHSLDTPSTIAGSVMSRTPSARKESRTPFSDISNRSADIVTSAAEAVTDEISSKALLHKSVSFHQNVSCAQSSVTKVSKQRPPVTPFARIEANDSDEDDESDGHASNEDINFLLEPESPAMSVATMVSVPISVQNKENAVVQNVSVVEKQLFLGSSEKQRPPTASVSSAERVKASPMSTYPSIMEAATQPTALRKEERRALGATGFSLDLATDSVTLHQAQIQQFIQNTNSPKAEQSPISTSVSLQPLSQPGSASTTLSMSTIPRAEDVFDRYLQQHIGQSSISPAVTAPALTVEPAAPAVLAPPEVIVTTQQPQVIPSASQNVVSLHRTLPTSTIVSNVTTLPTVATSATPRTAAIGLEGGVSFGRGPTMACFQSRKVGHRQQVNGFKPVDPTLLVPLPDTKLLVEVEKPVVSVCKADLHPAKAWFSPNTTRKSNVSHWPNALNPTELHKPVHHPHMQPQLQQPVTVDVASTAAAVEPRSHTQSVPTVYDRHISSTKEMVEEGDENMLRTHQDASVSMGDYHSDLSSIRAMNVSIQVDSAMFSPAPQQSKANAKKQSSTKVEKKPVGISVQTETSPRRAIEEVKELTASLSPSSLSTVSERTERRQQQSNTSRISTLSSPSGTPHHAYLSYGTSMYAASDEDSDEDSVDLEKSFALADLMAAPTIADRYVDAATGYRIPSVSNPWAHRLFDSRLCSVGSEGVPSPPATSTLAASHNSQSSSSAQSRATSAGTADTSLAYSMRSGLSGSKVSALGRAQRVTVQQEAVEGSLDDDEEEDDDRVFDDEEDVKGAAFKKVQQAKNAAKNVIENWHHSYGDVRFPSSTVVEVEEEVGSISTECDVSTVNRRRNKQLDLTLRTDVAVTHFTAHDLSVFDDADANYEDSEQHRSMYTAGAETTFTLDQSFMTKTTLLSTTSNEQPREVVPRFAIKSLTRDPNAPFEVKEINFETAPGEFTTVMLSFGNQRAHSVTLDAQTALVRVEPLVSAFLPGSPNAMADYATAAAEASTDCFSVSPGHVKIAPHSEASIYVTFAPPASVEGIFSGAMRLRHGRKAYTLLLRGESAIKHSAFPTPMTSVTKAPQPVPSDDVDLSSVSHIQPSCTTDFAVSTSAALPIRHQQQQQQQVTDSSIVFPSHTQSSFLSPGTTAFQERLRALHERIAEISRKVLWKEAPQSHQQQLAFEDVLSPSPTEVTTTGLSVQPETLKVTSLDDYHCLSLQNPQSTRVMMVRIETTPADVLRVSTNLVSLRAQADETRILLKVDRLSFFRHCAPQLWANHQQQTKTQMCTASLVVGTVKLQYDSDLEMTVPVVLDAAVYDEVIQAMQQMHAPVPSAVTTTVPASVRSTPQVPSAKKQSQWSAANSDYHAMLAYQQAEDSHHNMTLTSSAASSIAKTVRSQMTTLTQHSVATASQQHQQSATAVNSAISKKSTATSYTKPPLSHQKPVQQQQQASSSSSSVAASIGTWAQQVHHQSQLQVSHSLNLSQTSLPPPAPHVPAQASQQSSSSMMMMQQQHHSTSHVNHTQQNHSSSQGAVLVAGARRGLYFDQATALFGSVAVGSLVRTRVILANASNVETTVYLGDPDLPFVLQKNALTLRPRSFMRVPVRFLPIAAGHYHSHLIAQSADGEHVAQIALSGYAYA